MKHLVDLVVDGDNSKTSVKEIDFEDLDWAQLCCGWDYSDEYLLDDIKSKQLKWYGHVQRMEEERLPKNVMKWSPPWRRKRGRPKATWAEGIRGLLGEKGVMEEDWNDRDKWRKKIV